MTWRTSIESTTTICRILMVRRPCGFPLTERSLCVTEYARKQSREPLLLPRCFSLFPPRYLELVPKAEKPNENGRGTAVRRGVKTPSWPAIDMKRASIIAFTEPCRFSRVQVRPWASEFCLNMAEKILVHGFGQGICTSLKLLPENRLFGTSSIYGCAVSASGSASGADRSFG